MNKELQHILPLLGIENDCILSKGGDVTVVFKATLPELFTLSNDDYESIHQTLIKAIRVLPRHTVYHQQDWFIETKYDADFTGEKSFFSRSSERFFNERPYLDHSCYIMLTRRPPGTKVSSSLFSTLIRKSLLPKGANDPVLLQEFFDSVGQFARILSDSGFISLRRLNSHELASDERKAGLPERYCYLTTTQSNVVKDIHLKNELQIGGQHCLLYTLSDAENVPSLCGSRVSYDRYSTDRTKFSIGFTSGLGQLLPCSHIYNQYIFIGDTQKTLRRLESKRLRLQSLSAYSRENAIANEAVNGYLNEALGAGRQPVKAHFNILVWTEDKERLTEIRNMTSSALAAIDATPKVETSGAAQIWWAGMPGNEGDFPMNDTWDTFLEQATCFLNLETAYRTSLSPVGIRLGDRLTGKPVHVNISDEPVTKGICTNRNKFILGPSGSGKSFFTNHMVRSYYEQGTHIVLVDVGHSYKGLCDLVKGYYFTYSEQNPIRFNPFFLGEAEVLDTEKKESIKTLLLALWK